MNREKILKKIRSAINKENPDAEIILFGSRARGDENERSDWDILIIHDEPDSNKVIEKKYREEIFNIELETGEAISTFVHSKTEWEQKFSVTPLYQNVKEDGIYL